MNQLDVYYRALFDYRQQTIADHNCTSLRNAIATSDVEQDKIVIKRTLCTIERDWVDAIQEGLVHVEKALKEERQFIRSEGEVVPIEKVRHVSRDSVAHLAKHSDLITSCDDIDNIIPEKLYMIERLSDYAVYENRFLYMLLCYLRDFITIRYNDILDLSSRYEADINFNKRVSTGKRKMTYSLSMHDVQQDDPYLKENNPDKDIIDRIHLLLKTVIAFLGLPLMQEVSKVAMLKPPITKTNVLRMNNNFKGAVALYEFIMAYDKKGYQVEEQITTLAPFQEALADELAEAGGLVSFVAYEYGLAINKELKESYLREEERRKVEKINRRSERIATLKRRLQNSEISIEEYTMTLEDQLRDLEGQAARAERLAEALEVESKKVKDLTKNVEMLTDMVNKLNEEIEELKIKHFEEMERLKQEHEDAMRELILKHEAEVNELIAKYEAQINELIAKYEAQISELITKYETQINELIAKHEAEINELVAKHEAEVNELIAKHEAEVNELTLKYETEMNECIERHAQEVQALNEAHEAAMQREKDAAQEAANRYAEEIAAEREASSLKITALSDEFEGKVSALSEDLSQTSTDLEVSRAAHAELLEKYRVANARIKVLGGITENYTDRERFNELECEYNAFTQLYKQQWKETKKEIKKQHLNVDNLRDKKGEK